MITQKLYSIWKGAHYGCKYSVIGQQKWQVQSKFLDVQAETSSIVSLWLVILPRRAVV